MLNFELSAKPILNYSILNCELEMNTESKWEIKTQTTQSQNSKLEHKNLNTKLELNNSKLKTEQLKIGFADNSKLKTQNSKLRSAQQFKTQNSKLKT